MNAKNAIVNLMDELAAIRDGLCIWCSLGQVHPAYSRCSHAEHGDHINTASHEAFAMAVSVNRTDKAA